MTTYVGQGIWRAHPRRCVANIKSILSSRTLRHRSLRCRNLGTYQADGLWYCSHHKEALRAYP